ncbi:MAG: PEP-CTERM sorting domain-containing protein [Alteromonadales bacterium]|nr:PEP-CTERM sorting domain-containing protein [Alteromonadales bacterium]
MDGKNIATLPGSDTFVTIDNVNDKRNSEYFIDNIDASYNLQADGFTTMLQISVLGLNAGTHSMEFAIADAGDSSYDSWLLIETGSFTTKPVDIPAPAGILLFALGLAGFATSRKYNK